MQGTFKNKALPTDEISRAVHLYSGLERAGLDLFWPQTPGAKLEGTWQTDPHASVSGRHHKMNGFMGPQNMAHDPAGAFWRGFMGQKETVLITLKWNSTLEGA